MKNCPKCQTPHEKPGIFCSRSCSNSRVFSDESRRKKREANQRFWSNLSDDDKTERLDLLKHASYIGHGSLEDRLHNVMSEDWEKLGFQGKRLRVILEQNGACNRCGLTHWLEQRLTLEYEHKDGDNTNNARNNVEALCPNCHSQTETWRGRKNGKRQRQIEQYIELVEVSGLEPESSPNLGFREV